MFYTTTGAVWHGQGSHAAPFGPPLPGRPPGGCAAASPPPKLDSQLGKEAGGGTGGPIV